MFLHSALNRRCHSRPKNNEMVLENNNNNSNNNDNNNNKITCLTPVLSENPSYHGPQNQ